jgi:hypothetical protein
MSSPDPSPPSAPGPSITDELLAYGDKAAATFNRIVAGSYTSADAIADATSCAESALASTLPGVTAWWSIIESFLTPPRSAAQPSSRVPGQVDIPDRPLTLHTIGFRAIGYGCEYFIHQNEVVFEPSPRIEVGADPRFVMNVDWKTLPAEAKRRTIIYEGEVTAAETGRLVTDPIRFVKPAFSD